MSEDQRAIRELVATWMTASAAGDLGTVLGLMTDDVTFMVPGAEAFGKEAFAAASTKLAGATFAGTSDVREVQVIGDWAFARSYLEVATTTPGNGTIQRKGWVLSIFRKGSDGRWRIARDANLLAKTA
jgi:uncharacterized protein (TIGR02246 family)